MRNGWAIPVVAMLLSSCGGASSPGQSQIEADLAAIEEVNRRTVQALNDGDLELLNAMVAENHIMMIPGRPEIIGKEAIEAANRNLVESWDNVEIWTPKETVVAGGWAYQRGEYDITLTPKRDGVQPIRSVGKYLHIYERQDDGSWLMIRDMFSDNGPVE
jgi:ketosteroid isomerase-like protein